MSYDPKSTDSMFSRILQRMEAQDDTLKRIEAGVQKTNGRVNSLERWRDVVSAKAAGISFGVALIAWMLDRVFR
jgi:hypothetical protein